MNIQDALKETGKAVRGEDYNKKLYAAIDNNGQIETLYWHTKDSHDEDIPVSFSFMQDNKWQPYHEKKEIRPEKAGELWRHDDSIIFINKSDSGIMRVFYDKGESSDLGEQPWHDTLVHGNGTAERLHPPVEDKSVERVIFKDIEIESCCEDIIML